ncbi:FRG domain-containing protein [Nocardiopsis sp. JB363]|uniref:FRG domain-containing protein n=1 Tax=Nocardiopsis sp. JB363 TaxID=1434837 RepID=UPI0013584C5E|nr:FRG domain-containing protein [Nocardiopsis sp. JB363]
MDLADAFFRGRSINAKWGIKNEDDLWKWILEEGYCKVANWHLEGGENLFFRGQANSGFGLTSSLYRKCRSLLESRRVEERDLELAESSIMCQMRKQGIGRRMTDGQLLMVLQHHGTPTRLLDVCGSPFESLFFAVNDLHRKDGCLFLIHPHGDGQDNELRLWETENLPWAGGKDGGVEKWTSAVYLTPHKSLDPRMHAQNGQFLVGGLSRVFPGQKMRLSGNLSAHGNGGPRVPVENVPDISSLNLNFLRSKIHRPNLSWGGTAWVLLVKADWKEGLMARLQAHEPEISFDTMYPPLGEVSRLADFIVDRIFMQNNNH